MPLAYPFEPLTRRIVDLTEALARRLAPSAAEHDRRGDFARDNLQALHEAGYLRLALPRAYGGEVTLADSSLGGLRVMLILPRVDA